MVKTASIIFVLILAVFGLVYILNSLFSNQLFVNKQNTPSPLKIVTPAKEETSEDILYLGNEGKIIREWDNNQAKGSLYFAPSQYNQNVTSKKVKLIEPLYFEAFKNPQFSPNGKRLIFDLGLGGDAYAFYLTDLTTGKNQKLQLEYKCCSKSLEHISWINNDSILVQEIINKTDASAEKVNYLQINVNDPTKQSSVTLTK